MTAVLGNKCNDRLIFGIRESAFVSTLAWRLRVHLTCDATSPVCFFWGNEIVQLVTEDGNECWSYWYFI
jgi:hypothetical protein